MANIVRIKRRATGAAGAPASLQNAELAFNEVDSTLYYGRGTGGAGGTATTVDAIAGSGAFVTLTSAQNITGAKTFTSPVTVALPTLASHATTKAYVDSFLQSVTGGSGITVTPGTGTATIAVDASIARLLSPALTGVPTAPTAATVTNNTQLATTAFVKSALAEFSAVAPTVLGGSGITVSVTGNAATVTADATVARLASPALTGVPTAPTAAAGTNTNQLATMAAVFAGDALQATATTQIIAGNGLEGGGTLQTNRTISLGLPGTLTNATTNSVTATSHTHSLTVTKADVGLPLADNTADASKPVSTAQLAALNLKANLASPALTGVPTAPTAAVATNTAQVATTAFVRGEVAALVGGAPAALDTLLEFATALGNDPNFATTITNQMGNKQTLNPNLTGISGVTTAANQSLYTTGVGTFAATALTAFGRSIMAVADAAATRLLLGLGTMSTQNSNAVSITGGSIDNITVDGGVF